MGAPRPPWFARPSFGACSKIDLLQSGDIVTPFIRDTATCVVLLFTFFNKDDQEQHYLTEGWEGFPASKKKEGGATATLVKQEEESSRASRRRRTQQSLSESSFQDHGQTFVFA